MQEEWLDIVDADNQVVGRAPRDVIHREGLCHRSVHMLVFRSDGRLFLQKRSLTKDTNAGLWDSSAAGHVDSGEMPLDAAVRELAEELGIHVSADEFVRTGQLTPAAENGFEFVEMYHVCSDQAVTLEADEIDDGRWVTRAELEDWLGSAAGDFTKIFHLVLASVLASGPWADDDA